MALDGTVISALAYELDLKLSGGRISKIAQPETDELLLTIKNQKDTYKLTISASASLPLMYITDQNKLSPLTAPNFCMLLRKHIGSGRILKVSQPGLERIINIDIEHLDEMGDLCRKTLIVELMGKHSNIIFCDSDAMIIDSIKHVPAYMSSVREVLPGRSYFIPDTMDKKNPLATNEEEFTEVLKQKHMKLSKALYTTFTGISPIIGEEVCHLAGMDSDAQANELSDIEALHLARTFMNLMDDIKNHNFAPQILYENDMPAEFSVLPLSCLSTFTSKAYPTVSLMLEDYYESKNRLTRIRQKSVDLRQVVSTSLERNRRKYDLQLKQLKDTEKMDKYKVYGELINTYGYEVTDGSKEMKALNYYTGEEITIPLDPMLSVRENAQKYFDKYVKLKRTADALTTLTAETKDEIDYLESVSNNLDIALAEEDLVQIKEELREAGYIKKRGAKDKKARITSKPLHYISSDGFHIYVGKNNLQNDELTFSFATGGDWWFHAKGIAGSHVILKTEGKEVPDRTFEEAAALAAYYSKSRESDKVEIDYIKKKEIRKVPQAKPGFVIYHTNYSMVAKPDIGGIRIVE
ncbi:MAG: NFACT family protein [Lachnospiraceae bacterium]|nr:NFACT family protein [Lachnospiraceae bacterium]